MEGFTSLLFFIQSFDNYILPVKLTCNSHRNTIQGPIKLLGIVLAEAL